MSSVVKGASTACSSRKGRKRRRVVGLSARWRRVRRTGSASSACKAPSSTAATRGLKPSEAVTSAGCATAISLCVVVSLSSLLLCKCYHKRAYQPIV